MASIKDLIQVEVEKMEKAQSIKGSVSAVSKNIERMRKAGEIARQSTITPS